MGRTHTVERSSRTEAETVSDGIELVLRTRQPVCGPRADAIDRLSALDSDDAIAGYRVETWPDEVVVSGGTTNEEIVALFEQYDHFAEDQGLSIRPPFERKTVSPLIGQSREVLTLPVLCLAVYRDDDLRGLFPCRDGDRTWSVQDYLDFYEDGEGQPSTGSEDSAVPPFRDY